MTEQELELAQSRMDHQQKMTRLRLALIVMAVIIGLVLF